MGNSQGKEDENPKGLPSPSTTYPGSRGDGILLIEGKVFNCCVEDLQELNVPYLGLFGSTYQMIHKPTGHIMAVKRIRIGAASRYQLLLMDLDALSNLNSPYLVPYYGALLREEEVWICMELMRASIFQLHRRVYATPGRRMPEEVLRQIAIAVSHTNFYTVDPWIKMTSCITYLQ